MREFFYELLVVLISKKNILIEAILVASGFVTDIYVGFSLYTILTYTNLS